MPGGLAVIGIAGAFVGSLRTESWSVRERQPAAAEKRGCCDRPAGRARAAEATSACAT